MDPFEIIASTLLAAGLDPDEEVWGFRYSPHMLSWEAFAEDIFTFVAEDRIAAAEGFATQGINTCTPWREWSDDDGVREGYTRKYKGLRVRIIRGKKADVTPEAPTDRWTWEFRFYAIKDGEPDLLSKFEQPPCDDDAAKKAGVFMTNRVIGHIKHGQQRQHFARIFDAEQKQAAQIAAARAAKAAKENPDG